MNFSSNTFKNGLFIRLSDSSTYLLLSQERLRIIFGFHGFLCYFFVVIFFLSHFLASKQFELSALKLWNKRINKGFLFATEEIYSRWKNTALILFCSTHIYTRHLFDPFVENCWLSRNFWSLPYQNLGKYWILLLFPLPVCDEKEYCCCIAVIVFLLGIRNENKVLLSTDFCCWLYNHIPVWIHVVCRVAIFWVVPRR